MHFRSWIMVAAVVALGGCQLKSAGSTPAPAGPPPRAVVALSDIINNIKCDMLEFEHDNPYLTTLGRSMGGTITVTIDRSHSAGGGIAVGIPIAAAGKLQAGIAARSSSDFGETLTIPFVMTYDQATAGISCPDFKNPAARAAIKGVSADGVAQTYHLNGPLLNLGALREQIDKVYQGNPMIGFVGFNFDGTIVLARDESANLGLNVYFINPSVAAQVADSYKISYHIGTNWQHILREGKYLDDAAKAAPLPVPVREMTAPPPAAALGFAPRRTVRTPAPPASPPDTAASEAPPPVVRRAARPVDGALDEAGAAAFIRALQAARPASPPE